MEWVRQPTPRRPPDPIRQDLQQALAEIDGIFAGVNYIDGEQTVMSGSDKDDAEAQDERNPAPNSAPSVKDVAHHFFAGRQSPLLRPVRIVELQQDIPARDSGLSECWAMAPWVAGNQHSPSEFQALSYDWGDSTTNSKPSSPNYDCIVIGSGYGGASALNRMARHREHSSAAFEHGREGWAVDYPEIGSRSRQTDSSIPVSRRVKLLRSSSLYDLWVGRHEPSDAVAALFHGLAVSQPPFRRPELTSDAEVLFRTELDALYLRSYLEQYFNVPLALQESEDAMGFYDDTPVSVTNMDPTGSSTEWEWRTSECMSDPRHYFEAVLSSRMILELSSLSEMVLRSIEQNENRQYKDDHLPFFHHGMPGVLELALGLRQVYSKQGILGILEQAVSNLDNAEKPCVANQFQIDLFAPSRDVLDLDNPLLFMKGIIMKGNLGTTVWSIVQGLLAPGITPLEDPG